MSPIEGNVSPSNKESGNKLILENNTDHIGSKNKIVHELLDVEFEQLLKSKRKIRRMIGKIFCIKINSHVI